MVWSAADVDALLTPFQEPVLGQPDGNGDPQTVQAVVRKLYEVDQTAPQSPVTRHYWRLEFRTADAAKLGVLNDRIIIRGEGVGINELTDQGHGITEAVCG